MASNEMIVAAFIVVGTLFALATLAASWFLAPKRRYELKEVTYESGEEPIGSPWVQVRTGYYNYALMFVIFDIEIAFFFPWAMAYGHRGWFILIEMVVFVGILLAGLAYAWKEGALRWR